LVHPERRFVNQGWEKPQLFSRLMYWVFGFNAKTPPFANETMVLFQHPILGN
jgi:hypothetical protein